MEKRTRTRLVEIKEEYYVSTDGEEFETAEQCMEYENTQLDKETRSRSTITFGKTQGKKGHKAPRINMAFSPENYKWIKTRSRQIGISATEFVNTILERERLKNN